MARRNKEDEKLDFNNLEKVIKLLEAEKPISKKDACAILNIAYNTTRLSTLIEKHKEKKDRDARHRAAKRGKPATQDEIQYIITAYMEGGTVDAICQSTYRGPLFVKNILEEYNVPVRAKAYNYFKPELIPEGAMRDRFNVGEIVYSARYDSLAEIKLEQPIKDGFAYRVWLKSEQQQQFAYQPAWELASLQHLTELGIKF